MIGVIATSGLRIGETLALDDAISISSAGVHHPRWQRGSIATFPLHPTTTEALRGYAAARDGYRPAA